MKNTAKFILMCFFIVGSVNAEGPIAHVSASGLEKIAPIAQTILTRLARTGITVWALGKIFVDTGYRYDTCKKIARDFADQLRKDSPDMTEAEISFWSFVQA